MFTLKLQKNVKKVIALTLMAGLIVLLAGPAFAKKDKDNASQRNPEPKDQASQPAAQAPQQPAKVAPAPPAAVTVPQQSPMPAPVQRGPVNMDAVGRDNARPQIKEPAQRMEPGKVQRTKEPDSIAQKPNIVQKPNVTFDNSTIKKNYRADVPVSNPVDNTMAARPNVGAGIANGIKTTGNLTPAETSRIGNAIGTKQPAIVSPIQNSNRIVSPQQSKGTGTAIDNTAKADRRQIGGVISADADARLLASSAQSGTDDSRMSERKARTAEKEPQKGTDNQRRTGQNIDTGRKNPAKDMAPADKGGDTKIQTQQQTFDNGGTLERKSRTIGKNTDGKAGFDSRRKARPVEMSTVNSIAEGRYNRVADDRTRIANNNTVINNKTTVMNSRGSDRHFDGHRDFDGRRDFDRHNDFRWGHHSEHVFFDHHRLLSHRIIAPSFSFNLFYSCGPWYTVQYFHPYYHRKYVFVSLCGYWPAEYTYMRYYWYGYYPYQWYGYYPVPYEVQGDTYNYYTYNYYTTGGDGTATQATGSQIQPVDENTYKDVREKLAQEKAANKEPAAKTTADTLFDEGVKAFENGDYAAAAEKFAKAGALSPEDMVLPFAQSQAFLASEKYDQAAQILRTALLKVTPEKEGVFYPRGLYQDDDVLLRQIDQLKTKAEQNDNDADLQLLLGYQLLGTGEIDSAVEPLHQASLDSANNRAAITLIKLLDQIRAAQQAEENKSK